MERDEKPADFLLPESVKSWFSHVYTALLGGNVADMAKLYDRDFPQLTNNYFKQSQWPEPDAIASLVDDDQVFLLLYKQIYFRHMFSRLQPGAESKLASWQTHCAIFDGILDGSLDVDVLPPQWAFDIVGEFVYQYQSLCQHRAKHGQKVEDEMKVVTQTPVWDTPTVLNYLQALINKSKILDILSTGQKSKDGPSEVLKQLGFFSLISLSRAHVLFGDYYTAIQLLQPLQLTTKKTTSKSGDNSTMKLHEKAPMAHVSVYYHLGFAQLMLQDLSGAIRSLSTIVLHVHRSRNIFTSAADADQIYKLADKALALLAVALHLSPGYAVGDQLLSLIRDKHGDKQTKLQKGDLSALDELFSFAAPKFILPGAANEEDAAKKAQALQLQHFKGIVSRMAAVPSLRSYIKLYRSLDLEKLASFREVDVETARCELMARKNAMVESERAGSKSDARFHLDDGIVRVDEEQSHQRPGQFFLNHIQRCARAVDNRSNE